MVDQHKTASSQVGSARDPAFLRTVRPILELFASYFRSEVRGFERLPRQGPFLVVGNHSGGQIPPDLPVLLTAWWRERGEDEPVYALFHSDRHNRVFRPWIELNLIDEGVRIGFDRLSL